MSDGSSRAGLAVALRGWRERMSPAEVGLTNDTPRRTPGLRREEVAGLAGVSVDYLRRLEQARGAHPSVSVLRALARALRLSPTEYEHLMVLAGQAPPALGAISTTARASVARLLHRFSDMPVMVVNARGDVIAWNHMAPVLLGDLSATTQIGRNIVWRRFVGGWPHEHVSDEDERERLDRATVADLQAGARRYPDDQRLRDLVAALRRRSTRFAELWATDPVEAQVSTRTTLEHPEVGRITVDCDALEVPGDDQTVVVYSAAPGSVHADKLALLAVSGSAELAD